MKSPCDHVSPILTRKLDRLPTNNAITCKKHDFLIDAAKSGYKWIFTSGTENEIQRGQNQNVNMKEKIKIRSSELADIKQELKRNERNLNRLVRRSHNLVKDIL
ncbi:hypothetical protein FSP39_003423 [Pinctada imbricata]|uniref:Uncharacterized protein n=1 Tax=Pinctada imbricata TaxID=66713 RepID=A0AA88Y1Z1_PINIB|nr:hypothetical protein FSP39_003423 [Pinctada imbricata]